VPTAPKPPSPGKGPPKPRGKNEPEDLAEVERALSVLEGRHPEFVKAQREARDAADVRKKALAELLREEARRTLRKRLVHGSLAVAAVALVGVIGVAYFRARAIAAGLDALSGRYTASGFEVVASSMPWTTARLEAEVAPGCTVVLTSRTAPESSLRIQHGAATITGKRSVGWCACSDENVVATSIGGADAATGIRIVHADGRVVGGRKVWATSAVRPETLGPGGDECGDAELDAWLTDKRYGLVSADAPWIDAERFAPLRTSGFRTVAAVSKAGPFAVVEPKEGRCYLALSDRADDSLEVRVTGPEHVVAKATGPIAWCDPLATKYTVWREGSGDVAVFATASERVGGLLGTTETASRAGIVAAATWLRSEDHGWNARAVLRASGLADAVTIVPEGNPPTDPPNARFVALSLGEDGRVEPATVADLVFYCTPSFEAHAPQTVCVETGALKWRRAGWRPAGAAAAALPFWMQLFEPVQDPEVLKLELSLLALARRLKSQGFEPTILEGIKELRTGDVEILGRAGEDAVVAVALLTRPPWIVPYSDGPDWRLGDDPKVVPLEPGSTATLSTRLGKGLAQPEGADKAKSTRRTVVFRRAQQG
jgi:hypothetical protein